MNPEDYLENIYSGLGVKKDDVESDIYGFNAHK
jgi:hypothetical protein